MVTSAAVLESLPLAPADAADYLTRWLPPRPSSGWQRTLADLRATHTAGSGSAESEGALAGVAATPLGLWLLRSVYSAPGADPAELDDRESFPTPAELQGHLFERLIPALIALRRPSGDPAEPFRPRRHHDPAQVRRRLGYLAHHLTCRPAMTGGDSGPGTRDFAWWQLAATTPAAMRATERGLALFLTLLAGLLGGLMFGLGVGIAYGLALFFRIVFTARSWTQDVPGYADLRVRRRSAALVRSLTFGVGEVVVSGFFLSPVYGLVARYVFGLTDWLTFVLVLMLTGMIVGGGACGFVDWVETPTQVHHTTTPRSNWRADRTLNLVRISANLLGSGVMFGIAFGFAFGTASGLWPRSSASCSGFRARSSAVIIGPGRRVRSPLGGWHGPVICRAG